MNRCVHATVILLAALSCVAAEPEFPRTTIDLGCVVSDIDASARFYTEGIGFTEAKSFAVSGDLGRDAGLTDTKPFTVRVFVLGEGPNATKLKLMQIAGTAPRTGDTDFIHSHAGFRYLTIFVADTDAALARLAKVGATPLAKSPVALPDSIAPPGMLLTCVRDPDGNIVELIGPRRAAAP